MVFGRLAKPWGAILSGFDSQSLRHLWGVGPVVYAAGLSIRYFTGSNPVHPAIFNWLGSSAVERLLEEQGVGGSIPSQATSAFQWRPWCSGNTAECDSAIPSSTLGGRPTSE